MQPIYLWCSLDPLPKGRGLRSLLFIASVGIQFPGRYSRCLATESCDFLVGRENWHRQASLVEILSQILNERFSTPVGHLHGRNRSQGLGLQGAAHLQRALGLRAQTRVGMIIAGLFWAVGVIKDYSINVIFCSRKTCQVCSNSVAVSVPYR